MDCRSRVVRFCLPNEVELVREGLNSSHSGSLNWNLKDNKMMSERSLWQLVSVNNLDHDVPSIDSVLVVNEFQDVFPDKLFGVPPHKEIDFGIDLDLDT